MAGAVGISPAPCTYVNKYEGTYLLYKSLVGFQEEKTDHVIKSLARLFLPDILEFYSTKDSTEPEQQKREQDTKTLLPKG